MLWSVRPALWQWVDIKLWPYGRLSHHLSVSVCTRLFLCAGYLCSFHKPNKVCHQTTQPSIFTWFLAKSSIFNITMCECMHSGINLTNLQHHVCCMVTLSCLNYGLQTESFNLNDMNWGFLWKWHCKLSPVMEMSQLCRLIQYTEKCLCYRHPWNQNVILVGKLFKYTNDFCTFPSLLIYNYWGVFNSGYPLKMYITLRKKCYDQSYIFQLHE